MDTLMINVVFNEENKVQTAIKFKDFVSDKYIKDLSTIEVNESDYKEGSLGLSEVLASVSIIIKAANGPLTELARAVRDFVQNFRTDLEIQKDGKVLKIKSNSKTVIEVVKAFLDE